MAIPNGYRLLKPQDVGKKFGIDLEQVIYFDTNADMSLLTMGNITWIGGVIQSVKQHQLTMVFDNVLVWDKRNASVPSPYWIYDTYTIPSGTEITSYFTSGASWNNTFLYIKDIEEEETTDPYSIKIKNKEGIKLLTKDKDIHFDDDVKVTIDESLLGGGGSEEKGYTLTLKQYSNETKYKYYPFGDTSGGFQYRINGGEWQTFANAPITIENVRTIQFFAHATAEYGCSLVVKQNNNVNAINDTEIYCKYNYTEEPNNAQSFCMCLIEDTILFVGGTRDSISGGGAN
jgi:hypothetical protein